MSRSSSPNNGTILPTPILLKMEALKDQGENLLKLHHTMSLATPCATPSPHGSEHLPDFDEHTSDVQHPENPFASHTFYGPQGPNHDRVLHSIRALDTTLEPIRFASESEPIELPKEGALIDPNGAGDFGTLIEATFRDDCLGFETETSYPATSDVVHVTVTVIDAGSVGAQAGVALGDLVLAVNRVPVTAHMGESDILDLIQTSESPRTIVFLHVLATKASRALFGNSTTTAGSANSSPNTHTTTMGKAQSVGHGLGSDLQSRGSSLADSLADSQVAKASKALFKRSSNAIGSRLKSMPTTNVLGSRLKAMPDLRSRLLTLAQSKSSKDLGVAHHDSFCDGCAVTPVVGNLWSCSACADFTLCQQCYSRGIHGHEGTEACDRLNVILASEKLKKRCSKFTPELLECLCHDICKTRLDKYEYLGNWLAEIVGGSQAAKIVVRGIEIPQLSQENRANFVGLLMPLATNRTDIEVHIEWLEDTTLVDEESEEMLEKLRIWISDKKNRTKSPFA